MLSKGKVSHILRWQLSFVQDAHVSDITVNDCVGILLRLVHCTFFFFFFLMLFEPCPVCLCTSLWVCIVPPHLLAHCVKWTLHAQKAFLKTAWIGHICHRKPAPPKLINSIFMLQHTVWVWSDFVCLHKLVQKWLFMSEWMSQWRQNRSHSVSLPLAGRSAEEVRLKETRVKSMEENWPLRFIHDFILFASRGLSAVEYFIFSRKMHCGTCMTHPNSFWSRVLSQTACEEQTVSAWETAQWTGHAEGLSRPRMPGCGFVAFALCPLYEETNSRALWRGTKEVC